MKRLIVLLVVLTTASQLISGQPHSPAVSRQVAKAFQKHFPGSSFASWEQLDNDISAVRFLHKQSSCIAYYDEAGALMGCGKMLPLQDLSALPVCVTARVQQLFPLHEITAVQDWQIQNKHHYYFDITTPRESLSIGIDDSGKLQGKRVHGKK